MSEAHLFEPRQVFGPAPALGFENKQHYEDIRNRLMESFKPQDFRQHLLLDELTDCTWKMARYTRNTALLMDHRFQRLLAFQVERRQAGATTKDATGEGRAENNRPDPNEPEDVLEGLIEPVDSILLKHLPEVDHFRALEAALAYQDHSARAFKATAARRDAVLERLECYRPSLGGVLRDLSDEVIATELSELGSSPAEVTSFARPISSEAALTLLAALGIKVPRARIVSRASERRIEANRTNGRKSRGPRTAEGKTSSSRNALRHGLATISRDNRKLFADIERMANAFCNGDDNPLLFEQALVIAENELVLRCVSAERVATIERMRDMTARPLTSRDNSIGRAKAKFRAAKRKYAQLVRAKANNTNAAVVAQRQSSRSSPQSGTQMAEEPRKFRDDFDAVCQAKPDLDRLARYERRAWSRQKRAIRAFIEIKSSSNQIDTAVDRKPGSEQPI